MIEREVKTTYKHLYWMEFDSLFLSLPTFFFLLNMLFQIKFGGLNQSEEKTSCATSWSRYEIILDNKVFHWKGHWLGPQISNLMPTASCFSLNFLKSLLSSIVIETRGTSSTLHPNSSPESYCSPSVHQFWKRHSFLGHKCNETELSQR